jgi:arsenate reductase (thioredoxin)
MSESCISVLFLCKGNSARSIMGEAILNRLGHPRVRAYSAGSDPAGTVHPHTIYVLGERGYEIEGLTSKSWDGFGDSDAPPMHLVITVCDVQAQETCPIWPGRPARAHWSLPDPVQDSADHDDAREPFRAVREALEFRIRALLARLETLHQVERDTLEDAARAA